MKLKWTLCRQSASILAAATLVAVMALVTGCRDTGCCIPNREEALKVTLEVIREAIAHYRKDVGCYPPNLDALVDNQYLRAVPTDPTTNTSESWVHVMEASESTGSKAAIPPQCSSSIGMVDIRSGSPGTTADGTPLSEL